MTVLRSRRARREGPAAVLRLMMGLLLLAIDVAPGLAAPDSTATVLRADARQMWDVRTGIDNARRVRVSGSFGTFEAEGLKFEAGQPLLLGPRGPIAPPELTWASVKQIDALIVGNPGPPAAPCRGGILLGALVVTALALGPAIGADDAAEYSQRFWISTGVLFGAAVVIGVPAYHLSSHWRTVYRSGDVSPQP